MSAQQPATIPWEAHEAVPGTWIVRRKGIAVGVVYSTERAARHTAALLNHQAARE